MSAIYKLHQFIISRKLELIAKKRCFINYLMLFYQLFLKFKTEMGSCQSLSSQNQILQPMSFQGVQILCKTWKKTFNNLYDYTAQMSSLDVRLFTINKQTRILKIYGKYELIPYQQRDKKDFTGIDAVIDFMQNNEKKQNSEEKLYNIISKSNKSKQQPWLVIKSLPSKKYSIKQGDMLRIGKQKVRVKEMINRYQETKEEDQLCSATGFVYQDLTKQGKALPITEQQATNYQCKFCLDTGEAGSPLMAPCNCAGSSKYVHLKCVQTWLTKTINPRIIGKATIITWKPLVCELCHKTLPFKVYLDGKRYFTVNIPKPKKPYLVLNPIYKEKDKAKIYFLVSFADQKEMIIGRKTDSDILISDDSTVSRHHSKIRFDEVQKGQGKFYIEDNQSKFGTLVLLRRYFTMKNQLNGISLQLGGDLLELKSGKKTLSSEVHVEQEINKSQSDSSDDHEQVQQVGVQGPPEQLNQAQQTPIIPPMQ